MRLVGMISAASQQNNLSRIMQPARFRALHAAVVVRTGMVLQRNIYGLVNRVLVRAGAEVLAGRVGMEFQIPLSCAYPMTGCNNATLPERISFLGLVHGCFLTHKQTISNIQ